MNGAQAEDRWMSWQLLPKRLASRGYEVREGVEQFLQTNPNLRSFVEETGAKLREVFGIESELALELFVDPEAPEVSSKLFVMVKTVLDVEAAQALLDRFDEAWWLVNALRGRHLVQVSVEFG